MIFLFQKVCRRQVLEHRSFLVPSWPCVFTVFVVHYCHLLLHTWVIDWLIDWLAILQVTRQHWSAWRRTIVGRSRWSASHCRHWWVHLARREATRWSAHLPTWPALTATTPSSQVDYIRSQKCRRQSAALKSAVEKNRTDLNLASVTDVALKAVRWLTECVNSTGN